jgi:hypothetical protein
MGGVVEVAHAGTVKLSLFAAGTVKLSLFAFFGGCFRLSLFGAYDTAYFSTFFDDPSFGFEQDRPSST